MIEYDLIEKNTMFKGFDLKLKYAVVFRISFKEDWYDENYIDFIKPDNLRKTIIAENMDLFNTLDEAKKCYKVKKNLPSEYLKVHLYERLNDSNEGIMIE